MADEVGRFGSVPAMAGHFKVYARGLVHLSVCTDLPDAEVERRANIEEPTGISSRWRVSEAPAFSDGHPNPTFCSMNHARRHVLLEC